MRAIVRDDYGPPEVLELRDMAKPAPDADQVLVRVHAAGVNMADVDYLLGRPGVARLMTGMRAPRNRVLGLDVAGTVEAVGAKVDEFAPGDAVFGDLTEHGYGGFAEYVCAEPSAFASKPTALTFEEAATIAQAGVMAVQGLGGRGGIEPGQRVLINGAGGNVGPFAVQIAKAAGAEVTGVDRAQKLGMITAVGADHVIDHATQDVLESGETYDRILDVAAYRSIREWRRVLRPGGRYIVVPNSVSGMFSAAFVGPLISIPFGQRMRMQGGLPFAPDAVAYLVELIEAGKVRPVIDRRYALEDVPQALAYQEDGHPAGKIVVNICCDGADAA